MRQIYFSLSKDIIQRPPINDGELWKVYCKFNIDLQIWELMLVK